MKIRIRPIERKEASELFPVPNITGVGGFEPFEPVLAIEFIDGDYNIDLQVKYLSRHDVPKDYAEYKDRPELFDESLDQINIVGKTQLELDEDAQEIVNQELRDSAQDVVTARLAETMDKLLGYIETRDTLTVPQQEFVDDFRDDYAAWKILS